MSLNDDLSKWHDFTLDGIVVDWYEGTIRIHAHGDKLAFCLKIESFRNLQFPREFRWGPSKSINSARFDSTLGRIEIEMQSGDLLTCDCAGCVVESQC